MGFRKKHIWVYFLVFSLGVILIIYTEIQSKTKRLNAEIISCENQFNLEVKSFAIDRGYFILNKVFYKSNHLNSWNSIVFHSTGDSIGKFHALSSPFSLYKKANQDTLYIYKDNDTLFVKLDCEK